MKFKKVMALSTALILAVAGVGGCTSQDPKSGSTATEQSSKEPVSNTDKPIVYRNTGSSISTLSPHQYTSDATRLVLVLVEGSLFELIYDEDKDNMKFIPSMAKEMPVTKDNITWTIKLRDDLKFTNGKPINAKTFEYSWKMLLDPVLANPQAGNLFDSLPTKNAEAYYLGLSAEDYQKLVDNPDTDWSKIEKSENPVKWEDVGIKAIDDYTIELTFASECQEIDVVWNFSTVAALSPVDPEMYEACMNNDRTQNTYGTSLDLLAQSGRYVLKAWVDGQYRVYEKNKDYPTANIYTPDVIEEREITDSKTAIQLFQNNELDVMTLSAATYEAFKEDPRLLMAEGPVVWGYYINGLSDKNPILQSNDLRKAFFHATNRAAISKDVYKVYLPANYIVSRRAIVGNIFSNAQRYRDTAYGKANEGPNYSFDEALALEYFEKAYKENGNKKITMELVYFDSSESQKKCAEVLKEDYERIFGSDRFELKLKAMPVEAAYASYESREYEAGFGTMGQDSFNPWSSLGVWSSTASEKADTFYNTEFDSLQRRTSTGDLVMKTEERAEALGKMEALILDYMPWVPIYQNDGPIIYSDRIHIKPSRYITGVAYAALQADMDNNVERSIKVD